MLRFILKLVLKNIKCVLLVESGEKLAVVEVHQMLVLVTRESSPGAVVDQSGEVGDGPRVLGVVELDDFTAGRVAALVVGKHKVVGVAVDHAQGVQVVGAGLHRVLQHVPQTGHHQAHHLGHFLAGHQHLLVHQRAHDGENLQRQLHLRVEGGVEAFAVKGLRHQSGERLRDGEVVRAAAPVQVDAERVHVRQRLDGQLQVRVVVGRQARFQTLGQEVLEHHQVSQALDEAARRRLCRLPQSVLVLAPGQVALGHWHLNNLNIFNYILFGHHMI